MIERSTQETHQLVTILGRGDRHARHRQHVGDVVETHMGLAVFAHQSGAIHREDHRQLLHRDVVDDVVVGALEERRVDRDDRAHALGREPPAKVTACPRRCRCRRSARPRFLEDVGAGARRHRRRDHDEVVASPRERGDPSPKTCVQVGAARLLARFAVSGIVRREPVPLFLVRFRVREALPLLVMMCTTRGP
jgi:hypothetical protein